MRTLRVGDKGADVTLWENFLVGQGYYWTEVDGVFDHDLAQSTIDFQLHNGLPADGVVGPKTYAMALTLGFPGVEDAATDDEGPNWPPKPSFPPLSAAERVRLFGEFKYKPAGVPSNPEAILITDGWGERNITHVHIPQLKNIPGAPASCNIPFHAKAAEQLKALWAAWEADGLLALVMSFAGSWAPRFVRGSRTYLSNHAWGTAFDINTRNNALGAVPALVGELNSVRKLVPLANAHGFYWGGHWGYPGGNGRADGMHFEVARLI